MIEEFEFWNAPLEHVLRHFETSPQGLSTAESERRLRQYGLNDALWQRRDPLLDD